MYIFSMPCRPEDWQTISLAEDGVFWERLRGELCSVSELAAPEDLRRFNGFCENYRASPDQVTKDKSFIWLVRNAKIGNCF